MKISLTDREADVMQILWEHGSSLVSEVRDRLRDDLAYTTVLTVLRTLESKGYVSHKEEGRGHRYFSTVKQQVAQRSALNHLTEKLFQGSLELLFLHLVSDHKLSSEQFERLQKMLAEKSSSSPGRERS
jgi:predicted transcriptional regulator